MVHIGGGSRRRRDADAAISGEDLTPDRLPAPTARAAPAGKPRSDRHRVKAGARPSRKRSGESAALDEKQAVRFSPDAVRSRGSALGRSEERIGPLIHTRGQAVPLWYPTACFLCVRASTAPDAPGTIWTLTGISTRRTCRLGAERSLVQIQSPRLVRINFASRSRPQRPRRPRVDSVRYLDRCFAWKAGLARPGAPLGGRGARARAIRPELLARPPGTSGEDLRALHREGEKE